MIQDLIKNIDNEIEILREISSYVSRLDNAQLAEQRVLSEAIESLKKSMKLINNSIPKILNNITLAKSLASGSTPTSLERVRFSNGGITGIVTLRKEDRYKFIKELSVSESIIKKIRKGMTEVKKSEGEDFKGSRGYLKYSNKLFLDYARKWINKGYFKPLSVGLKKANIDILFETYVAMIFLTSLIAFFVSIFLVIFFMFFNVSLSAPFISVFNGSYVTRFFQIIWIVIALPIATGLTTYFYPFTERESIARRIDQELPFAVIHMSAISGSGIEPSQIFKIIGTSKEYPFLRREIRKVLNQINIYGYDLVTALNNVSKSTPSSKLSELLLGLATTISGGGSLSEFFDKRSETLLMNYRLEREKYAKLAETFMDIYISVVIATPMILMLLLILLSVTAPDIGFTPSGMSLLIILILAAINALFLVFLKSKQPMY